MSAGAVAGALQRALRAGLDWPAVEPMTEDALESRLYPSSTAAAGRPLPDFATLHIERKKPGVTLELLHLEYLEQHPDGYRYSQFCEHYRAWLKLRRLTMRQDHLAGEKLFADYSGKKPHIVDPRTGERVEVELFVAVLGASNYTYAEATATPRGPDWIGSHVRALAFLGGAPALIVPDQLRSGVTAPCRYEPDVQRTYQELATHYQTSVLPARPAHPRDKAKVEVGVQIAQRWILARLRHQTFSIDALNEGIAELLEALNDRTMRVYGASRRQLFERLDRPALRPLPATPLSTPSGASRASTSITTSSTTTTSTRCHTRSCTSRWTCARPRPPSRCCCAASASPRTRAASRAGVTRPHPSTCRTCTSNTWSGRRRASSTGHRRSDRRPRSSSRPSSPTGRTRSTATARASASFDSASATATSASRAACGRAVTVGARSYRHVDSILKNGIDRLPLPDDVQTDKAPTAPHENVRGRTYYH